MYELLQNDKPTKIYLDFDHSDVNDKEDFVRSTNKFIKEVLFAIAQQSNIEDPTSIPFYVLEASTNKKLSRHVIFECFLKDLPTVKAFVEFVHNEKYECRYLDRKVYTRNRLFRLIYSYKSGKEPSSALRIDDKRVSPSSYNPFHVFKTMIQAMLPPHYVGPFNEIKNEVSQHVTFIQLPNKTLSRTINGYSTFGDNGKKRAVYEIMDGLNDFVSMFSDDGVILSFKENDNFISCVIGGKRCPWIQRMHKSNNQYLTICKNTMRGFFQCSDPECSDAHQGMIPYGHVDLSFLWRQHLMKKNHQSL
jgi:hypothetical protein